MWGGARSRAWNTPQIYPGLGCARSLGADGRGRGVWGHAGKGGKGRAAGGAAGAGGVRTPGHQAPANAPRSLAPGSAVYKFGFFFFLVPEQSCSNLTTGKLEEGDGKQGDRTLFYFTFGWGGGRIKSVSFKETRKHGTIALQQIPVNS